MSAEWMGSTALGACAAGCGGVLVYIIYKLCSQDVRDALVHHDLSRRNLKVVITGGTRGLGLELAKRFLDLGDDVVLASRRPVPEAVALLRQRHPNQVVEAVACDVGNAEDVERVAQVAEATLGRVDIWINNAALSASGRPLHQAPPSELASVVQCNLLGSMYGVAAAMRVMARQSPPGGKVFLVDGQGAGGHGTPNNAAYGATKRALTQLKDSLVREAASTAVSVHMFSPGMVVTDLLISSVKASQRRNAVWAVNVLAESPDVVAKWLVPRIRGIRGSGAYFKFLTPLGACWRLLTASSRKGRFDAYLKKAE